MYCNAILCLGFCSGFEYNFWGLNFSVSVIFSLKLGSVVLFFSVYLHEYDHMGYFCLFETFGVSV